MTRGRIRVVGNAGMHLGAYMKGGTIDVSGNVTDWLGAEMSGGLIRVAGNAGGQVGAAYRGSLSGMTDGTIVVGGTAGLEVGMRMKRGIIVIRGAVRDFAGLQMKGGTIVLGGGAELRTGRMDDARHDRVVEADSTPANVLGCRDLQPHVPAHVRQTPSAVGVFAPLRTPRWRLSALHRRLERSRQRGNTCLARSPVTSMRGGVREPRE